MIASYTYYQATGKIAYEVRRFERPIGAGGKPDKQFAVYSPLANGVWVENLVGARVLFNLPKLLAAPSAPVYVVEGEKAAVRLQEALDASGVVAVVITTCGGAASGHLTPLDHLKGRRVVVLPDHDKDGAKYGNTIAAAAAAVGAAEVAILDLDGLPDHGDIVDWLAAGHDARELVELAVDNLASPLARNISNLDDVPDEPEDHLNYRETTKGLRRVRHERDTTGADHEVLSPLTNFIARIVGDVIQDDGAETNRMFEIEAQVCGGARRSVRRFTLPADRFSAMSWPTEFLGAGAIVYPGQSAREHARVAIQVLSQRLSQGIPERHVYTHTGWRQIDDHWLYLHAGGALGASGARSDVTVALDGVLGRYTLPDPAALERTTPDALVLAIRASLGILDIAPAEVMIPLFAAIWRAPIEGANFALHLSGISGGGKSTLAALAQQHFGAEMNAEHLPGSWASSGNALEAQAFSAKDALFVVDDFVPVGSVSDAARMHRDADRLLRGLGNGSGRARMRADTTIRAAKPPRGLIISTGEDTPRGQSLRARMLVLDHARGSLDWVRLTRCQCNASAGMYALAMAGYIQWIAERYDEARATLQPAAIHEAALDRVDKNAAAPSRHQRTSDATAQLLAALRLFARYAVDARAMTQTEADALLERADIALERVAAQQAYGQAQSDQVTRFLSLLGSTITSGAAHVAGVDGNIPDNANRWGWRPTTNSAEWNPLGRRVGWLENDNLYLDADTAFAAAQALGSTSSDPLTVTEGTLWKRLRDRGLLLSQSPSAGTLKRRVTCQGARRWVIHLHADQLSDPEARQALSPAQNPANPARPGIDSEQAPDSGETGWVSRLDSLGYQSNPANNPAAMDAENMGNEAQMAGLAGFAAEKSVRRTPNASARPQKRLDWLQEPSPLQGNPATEPSRKIQSMACEHPLHMCHGLRNGVLACGACGGHLQERSPRDAQ